MSSKASQQDLNYGLPKEAPAALVAAISIWGFDSQIEKSNNTYAAFDFLVADKTRTNILGWLEVKARRNAWDKYPTTMVSLSKLKRAKEGVKILPSLRYFSVFYFTDRIGYIDLSEEPDEVKFVGRRDRGGAGTDHAFYDVNRLSWCDDTIRLSKMIAGVL